jgi:hypothetical protein
LKTESISFDIAAWICGAACCIHKIGSHANGILNFYICCVQATPKSVPKNQNLQYGAGDMTQMVEHKGKGLSSNPSIVRKKKKIV